MLKLIAEYDNLINSVSNNIRGLKAYPKLLDDPKHIHLHLFFDKCLHNALNVMDLVIGLKYLDVSAQIPNQLEANYFARIVAHTCSEILTDTSKLFGKEVRNYVKINIPNSVHIITVEKHLKDIGQIYRKHFPEVNKVRNNLFGHKEENGLLQANMILAVDDKRIYSIGNELYKINLRLLGSIIALMSELP